ncbi:MAG: PD-(D/E)XK nuclease domain-containing protein [Chlamydiota bacterium]
MSLLQTFEIECIPLTALLFQMGYLTIKTRNPVTQFYQLKYPNEEVKTALHTHLCAALTKTSLSLVNSILSKLFSALVEENIEQLITCLTSVFSNIPYQLYESDKKPQEQERFYHAIVQALFVAAGIKSCAEYSTALGRADIIVELPKLFYVIEIKVNKPPEVGISQIEEQKYYMHLLHLHKPIHAIGISFRRKKADAESKGSFSITYVTKVLRADETKA